MNAVRVKRILLRQKSLPFHLYFCAHKMASEAATKQKHEWIVILPDREGALAKRMEVRP